MVRAESKWLVIIALIKEFPDICFYLASGFFRRRSGRVSHVAWFGVCGTMVRNGWALTGTAMGE